MTLGANLLLALLWASLIGSFNLANLVLGFAIGLGILRICTIGRPKSSYVRRATAAVGLAAFTVWELIIANIKVAVHTLTPNNNLRPAILRVPIEPDLTDAEITLLSQLVTLTPGTLTLEVCPRRSAIYVHFMHVEDAEVEIDAIKEGFERRILEVTR